MEPIPVLLEDRGDEGRLLACAPPESPGHVLLDYAGPGAVALLLSVRDARRLMYQLACTTIEATQLARESETAAATYAHA